LEESTSRVTAETFSSDEKVRGKSFIVTVRVWIHGDQKNWRWKINEIKIKTVGLQRVINRVQDKGNLKTVKRLVNGWIYVTKAKRWVGKKKVENFRLLTQSFQIVKKTEELIKIEGDFIKRVL
jgi:hypothetical protein